MRYKNRKKQMVKQTERKLNRKNLTALFFKMAIADQIAKHQEVSYENL